MIYKSRAYCQKCKAWDKPLLRISVGRSSTMVAVSYMCRDCNRERIHDYYHRNKEKFRAIIYKSIKKHKHKQNARKKLNKYIKAGKIIKPDTCSICHNSGRIEGHHHDYSKPLEVTWLCTNCHADADKNSAPTSKFHPG